MVGHRPAVRVEHVDGRDEKVLENECPVGDMAWRAQLVADGPEPVSLHSGQFHDEHGEPAIQLAQNGCGPPGHRTADEELLPRQKKHVALPDGRGTDRSPVRRRTRLGHGEGSQPLPASQWRQEASFLVNVAERFDQIDGLVRRAASKPRDPGVDGRHLGHERCHAPSEAPVRRNPPRPVDPNSPSCRSAPRATLLGPRRRGGAGAHVDESLRNSPWRSSPIPRSDIDRLE
jgi:hypothetical protein